MSTVEVTEPAENEFVVLIRPGSAKTWKTAGLKIATHGADRWARTLSTAVAGHIVRSIKLGLKPQGGPQKPLKEGTQRDAEADKGQRPKARGFTDRARFVNAIRAKKIRATKTQATYAISADPLYDEWLIDEIGRGVDYYEVVGDLRKLIEASVNKTVSRLFRAARGATAARSAARAASNFP